MAAHFYDRYDDLSKNIAANSSHEPISLFVDTDEGTAEGAQGRRDRERQREIEKRKHALGGDWGGGHTSGREEDRMDGGDRVGGEERRKQVGRGMKGSKRGVVEGAVGGATLGGGAGGGGRVGNAGLGGGRGGKLNDEDFCFEMSSEEGADVLLDVEAVSRWSVPRVKSDSVDVEEEGKAQVDCGRLLREMQGGG